MTAFLKGPPLVVHILIATMVNAFFFPLIFEWAGSILYAFLASVVFLAVYGLLVLWLAGSGRLPGTGQPRQSDAPREIR